VTGQHLLEFIIMVKGHGMMAAGGPACSRNAARGMQ